MATRQNYHLPRRNTPARIPAIYKSAAPGPAKLPEPPFQLLVETFQEFVFLLNARGAVLAVSTAEEKISGQAREALLGHGLRDLLGQRGFARLAEILRRVLETDRREELECRVEMGDGPHWFEAQLMPAALGKRGARTLCLLARDVTAQKKVREELSRSKARLAQAGELANIGAWEYDLERRSFLWSARFYRMLGLNPAKERMAVEKACELMHPEDRARIWRDVDTLAHQGRAIENEARFLTAEGRVRIFQSRAIPIADPSGRTVSIRGMSRDITEERQAERDLDELSRRMLQVQDEEREKIAGELHDSTAQNLVALRMNLSRIKSGAALSDALREMLDSSIQFADASLQEVRTLSYLLYPPLVEEAGFEAALRRYAAGFAERSGIQVDVEIAEDLGRLRRDVETAVFRIVQEALMNAHRHSGSPAVRIGLARSAGNLELAISDRGCGMPPGPPSAGGLWPRLGVGLESMRERVEHLNGTLQIASAPGEGTTIHVLLPGGETP